MKIEKIEKLVNDVASAVQNLNEYCGEHGVSLVTNSYNIKNKTLHVYSGIEKLAEELGKEIIIKARMDSEYPYELSFRHNGITYFQIQAEQPN